MTQGHFDRLYENLAFIRAHSCHVSERFSQLAAHKEVCIEHIWQNQMVARATVPLMENVVRVAEQMPDDPVSKPLIAYMKKHIAEEMDHDKWYADDLKQVGISTERLYARKPTPNIAALTGSQYYWINHHHPVAFMGYLAVLEVQHPSVEYVESLIDKSGLPREVFSTVMEHATIDVNHKQDIIATLNSLPLTEEQYQLVEMSAFHTFRYVALVMEDVCNVARSKSIA